jgi:hypothetical protein
MMSMHKIALRVAISTATVGFLLLLPLGNRISYLFILTIHILLALILTILLVRLIYTHVPEELYNPFKRGFKKWNGFKLIFYLFLAIFSGLTIWFLPIRWVSYFHGFIGAWVMLVGWKHKKS